MTSGEKAPYDIFMAPSALRFYKKFPGDLQDKVKQEVKILAMDPYRCEELSGMLKGIRSYHFSFGPAQYRIAYQINESTRSIEIVLVKSRENFYHRLKRLFK